MVDMRARPRGGIFGHPYRNKPFPFDVVSVPESFPPSADDDSIKIAEEVLKYAADLTPTEKERAEMTDFVDKVKATLEKVRTATDADYLPGVVIDEVEVVGSFRKDTMLRGHRVADMVVVTKSMPTFESVAALGEKLCKEMSDDAGVVSMVSRDFGIVLTRKEDKVRLLISTVQSNTAALEKDLHLSIETIRQNHAAIYHARCFAEFSPNANFLPLVRVFKSMRLRFPGLQPINIWAFESLIQYCIITTPSAVALPAGQAFKRILSQLACGIFIPGASGLSDPVDHRYRLVDDIPFEEMDRACSTAQTLLRILCHGGLAILLGTDDRAVDINNRVTNVNGIAVIPLEKAWVEPPPQPEDEKEKAAAASAPGAPQEAKTNGNTATVKKAVK